LAICRGANGEIALRRQWSVPLRRPVYEFPAGGVEGDELLHEAVLRELREETGVVGTNVRWIGAFHNDVRRSSLITHVSVVDAGAVCASSPEPGEDACWEWVEGERIDGAIARGDFTNSSLLAAWCLYRSRAMA
jgi:8-oxo-dGTP pyrophosphatase MutT (NUDIX family)